MGVTDHLASPDRRLGNTRKHAHPLPSHTTRWAGPTGEAVGEPTTGCSSRPGTGEKTAEVGQVTQRVARLHCQSAEGGGHCPPGPHSAPMGVGSHLDGLNTHRARQRHQQSGTHRPRLRRSNLTPSDPTEGAQGPGRGRICGLGGPQALPCPSGLSSGPCSAAALEERSGMRRQRREAQNSPVCA